MAEEQLTQEQIIEQQKAQCPFCKIVKGEIPSTKIYEDDEVLAISDINPAVSGHVLLLPKEHYPILPIIPPKTSNHMFAVARDISRAQKKGIVRLGTNVFIANGGAAGQQSPHFMLHLLPRDQDDALASVLKLEKADIDKNQHDQIAAALKHNMGIAMSRVTGKAPPQSSQPAAPAQAQQPPSQPSQPDLPKQPERPVAQTQQAHPQEVGVEQKKKLGQYIEQDEEFKKALITDIDKAKEMIALDAELQELTKGIDIDALHERLKAALGDQA